ncbi:MAG: hypothetical protein ACRDOU_11825 [Streptosporangiaceae bacterium]
MLDRFRADGHEVAEIVETTDAEAAGATAEAIRSDVDLIYQGTLTGVEPGRGPALFGRPDFLVRADLLSAPDREPRPGGTHYEVVDAKLARTAKARAVLQTAFYSHLLGGLQGTGPRWMHLALGNGEFASFKVSDYAAYERQARRLLEAVVGEGVPDDPYPEPVEHCAICRWSDYCADLRRRDDDLSLVAGMTIGQRRALKADGIATRRQFAGLGELPGLSRVGRARSNGPDYRPGCRWPATAGPSDTRSCSPNATARALWSPTGGCSRCPSRPRVTCSSILRGRVTTPRTAGSSGCSTCSAS